MISRFSIAVLPFENIGSDPEDEYFADGITEETINVLSNLDGLHVTSRSSSFAFKNNQTDMKEVRHKLNVSYILEGSIRKSPNKIRITAQLIKADDGFHLWSETWDKPVKDIFKIQDEVAGKIANRINEKILIKSSDAFTQNDTALDLYFKGLFLLNQLDSNKGEQIIHLFEKSIEYDPKFSKPFVSLCNCYTWLGSTGMMDQKEVGIQVNKCINRLIELNHNIPELYVLLAEKNYWIDFNPSTSLDNSKKALELRPSYSIALIDKGMALASLGRIDEAFGAYFEAEKLDPFGGNIKFCIGYLYHLTGDSEKALDYINKNIELSPYWSANFITKAEILCRLNRFDEALEIIHYIEKDHALQTILMPVKGIYHSFKGEKEEALEIVRDIENIINCIDFDGSPYYYYLGIMHLKTGNIDKTLKQIEKGISFNSTPFLYVHIDSIWDEIREEPRFKKAISKIEIPLNIEKKNLTGNKYKKSNLPDELINSINQSLEIIMEIQKTYLHPTLGMPDLAEMLEISTNQLSQYLNEKIGKNFYEFLNNYRLKHFLEIMRNPKFSHLSILGMAYESGFNSKTTFNSFFKKELGLTPSEYVRAYKFGRQG